MMSQKGKRELLEVARLYYLKASKVEKQKMLDEFTYTNGYISTGSTTAIGNMLSVC